MVVIASITFMLVKTPSMEGMSGGALYEIVKSMKGITMITAITVSNMYITTLAIISPTLLLFILIMSFFLLLLE